MQKLCGFLCSLAFSFNVCIYSMFSLSINQENCSDLQVETIEPKVLTADNIFRII